MQLNKPRTGAISVQSHQYTEIHLAPPGAGGFKVNVDASVREGSSSFSVGIVLRDHAGGFCQARSARREGEVSVFKAEAWGVLEAIRWIISLGISMW